MRVYMKIFSNKFHEFVFKTAYIESDDDAKKALPLINTAGLCGIDIETAKAPGMEAHEQAGLCPRLSRIRLLQVFDGGSTSYVFDLFKVDKELLRPMLSKGRFVAHNGIFEIQHLTFNGFPDLNIGCSMLLSQLIEGAEHSPFEAVLPVIDDAEDDDDKDGLSQYRRTGHGLDAVTQRLFGVKVQKKEQTSDWGVAELSDGQIVYAGLDAVLTYKVARSLAPKIKEYKMEKPYELLKKMQHVVAHMQLQGLPVDWEYHANLIKTWGDKSAEALAACKPFFGEVNMRSGKQMSDWLVKYLKDDPMTLLAWPKTAKGSYAFSKTAVTAYRNLPAIAALLEYKKYAKLIDTYGDSLIQKKHPLTGRLHTSYTLGETRTGRLSSRAPNAQNYPRDKIFRNMFVAEPGHVLVVSDFSQIELRLQAEFSKDPEMRKVYKDGQDLYKKMASSFYKIPIDQVNKDQRFIGKTCLLALGYGMGHKKLRQYALNAGVVQPEKFWQAAHKAYYTTFSVYTMWCERMRDRATKLGYIETLLGKRRKLGEDEVYTRAPNTVIQGSAAELMMRAMLICYEKIKGWGELVATVHDEILLHVKEEDAERARVCLSDAMNTAMMELFPDAASHEVADAAYGSKWGDVKGEL